MRRRLTLIGAMLLHKGEADGMICGTWGTTARAPALHRPGDRQAPGGSPSTPRTSVYACMNGLMLPDRQVFLVDTHVNADPSAEQLAEITVMAAEEMRRFGMQPQGGAAVAFQLRLAATSPARRRCARTLALLREQAPGLEVDGEMHGDVALDADAARRS